jgi:cytochrome c-type biogenesis protein CcmF
VKPSVNIEVADGKSSYVATPKLYFSEYNQSMLREPAIRIFPLKDLYISPLEITSHDHAAQRPTLEIAKGETKEFAGYEVSFVKFDMSQHGENGGMAVGALLQVKSGGEVHEVTPLLTFDERGERHPVPATLPSLHDPAKGLPQIILSAISVEEKKVLLEISGTEEAEAAFVPELLVDISLKPLMMVVWTGVILIIAGTALAFQRRVAEKAA